MAPDIHRFDPGQDILCPKVGLHCLILVVSVVMLISMLDDDLEVLEVVVVLWY